MPKIDCGVGKLSRKEKDCWYRVFFVCKELSVVQQIDIVKTGTENMGRCWLKWLSLMILRRKNIEKLY